MNIPKVFCAIIGRVRRMCAWEILLLWTRLRWCRVRPCSIICLFIDDLGRSWFDLAECAGDAIHARSLTVELFGHSDDEDGERHRGLALMAHNDTSYMQYAHSIASMTSTYVRSVCGNLFWTFIPSYWMHSFIFSRSIRRRKRSSHGTSCSMLMQMHINTEF